MNILIIMLFFLNILNFSIAQTPFSGKVRKESPYEESSYYSGKPREKRTLIFPISAVQRVMYIFGIGIPLTDLEYESLTTGWVLKSQYILPYTANQLIPTQLTPQPIQYFPPQKRSVDTINFKNVSEYYSFNDVDPKQLPGYRWMLYRGLELLIDRTDKTNGKGRPCLLKSICEAAASPFHYGGGILSEIVHIILTPTLSTDKILHHTDNEFINAEKAGRAGKPCERLFHECEESILDKLTNIFHI